MSLRMFPFFTHDQQWFIVPFKYEYAAATDAADATYFPFSQTVAQFVDMWWNWKGLTATVTLDHGAGLQVTQAVTLSRNASAETDLLEPGAQSTDAIGTPAVVTGVFTGSYTNSNWNGGGGLLEIEVSLRICHWCLDDAGANPDSEYECSQRLYWEPGDTLRPSIILIVTYTISSPGTEYSATVTNYTPILPAPDWLLYGGEATLPQGTFEIGVISGSAEDRHQCDVSIVPYLYFGWNGARDTATGLPV
jgi:hypothetical protein